MESKHPLSGLDSLIWQSLTAGAESSNHPWNLGFLSTIDGFSRDSVRPRTRTVVLRDANRQSLTIDCHTDVRSGKVRQLTAQSQPSPVSWLFYEASTKIQLRLDGVAEVVNDDEADRAWQRTMLETRSSYLSIRTPGERSDGDQAPETDDRFVSQAASERGRANFRIVRMHVIHADWLFLRREGHLRAKIDYDAEGKADVYWVVP
jgi:hypothetical protein